MEDGEVKRKKLNLALSKAAGLGMSGGQVAAAEGEQKALTDRMTAMQCVSTSCSSRLPSVAVEALSSPF